MNILLESEGRYESTFLNTEYKSAGILVFSQHTPKMWVGLHPLPSSSLSGMFLGHFLPCHSFHNHLATPSAGDTFLPSSRLLFPAATYCQFIFLMQNKPASSALLFRWLAIPRIRATSSSNTRFYLTWFYSSLTSLTIQSWWPP